MRRFGKQGRWGAARISSELLCVGWGSKVTRPAELLAPGGRLTAVDALKLRVKELQGSAARRECDNIECVEAAGGALSGKGTDYREACGIAANTFACCCRYAFRREQAPV